MTPGTPDYELARAGWMTDYDATAKSFDRLPVGLRRVRVEKAQQIIANLEKAGFVVTHESDIAGG